MKRLILILSAVLLPVSGAFSQFYISPEMQKLNMATMAVQSLYVDSVSESKIVEDAIVGMLEELDPHSVYISKDEVAKMNEPLEGSFEGIGIQFQLLKDTLFVIQTIAGGPSEKVGIMAGDKIISVNDSIIAGVNIKNSEIQNKLRGKKGTSVNVKVLRRGEKNLIDFKIIRDKIPIYSLDAAYMLDKETGYIKLNRFAASTYKEFLEALLKLKSQGMKNLILDLQGNGGGYLVAATDLADEFLSKGQLIVYTEGNKQPRQVQNATAKGDFETGRLVVLIDETSASASEILSGAVQDWDRGVIVGRRSFGKGLVQRPIPLQDGSMIRLTVARYYTPSGRSIQRPYGEGTKKYNEDLIDRYNHGELQNKDSISFPDSLKKETLISKRTVYGGGGIMPDVFVPIDTTRFSTYHRSLINKGVMNRTLLNIVDKNRKMLNANYPDFKSFKTNFVVSEDFFNELVENAKEDKIEYNAEEFERSKELIGIQMKALIARDLWGINEYFEIINDVNESVIKGLEVINDAEIYNNILDKRQTAKGKR
jgi:carboxyl-terminal processing protease